MTTRQLFIIDPRVSDYQTFIADLPQGIEWVLLDATRDGVVQLMNILANYRELDAIQILFDGEPGALPLGSSVVNSDNLRSYAGALPAIRASLAETGCLLWRRRTTRSRQAAKVAQPGVQPGRRPGNRQAAQPA